MSKRKKGKGKGIMQNDVTKRKPIADNSEKATDKTGNSSPEKGDKNDTTIANKAEESTEKITADEEKDTDEKENKKRNILEKMWTNSSQIVTVVGLFSTLCAFINFIYNTWYQINCGNFYGIPEKYFSTNINKNILYRLIVIVLLILWLILPILEKYSRKQKDGIKFDTPYLIFLSVLIGIMMSAAVAHNLSVISTYDNNIILSKIESVLSNWNIEIVAVVLIALCIIVAVGITFLSRFNYWKKALQGIYAITIIIPFFILMAIIIHGTWITFTLGLNIENKTKYEFVEYECNEYVLLSEYNDKVLLVQFEVNEEGRYTLDTSEYILRKMDSGTYEYRNIEYPPEIKK